MNDACGPTPGPDDEHTTQIRLVVRPTAATAAANLAHSLRVVEGIDIGRRYRLGDTPLSIGRRPGNGLVIPDSEVSSAHCVVRAISGERLLEISDHASTNGTFADGLRVHGTAWLGDGGLLQIGRHVLLHECGSRADMDRAEQADRELERARHYVESLLPAPIREGPVRTDWFFRPSAMLGGDAFGYFRLGEDRFAGYVIDVTGHGVGVAMHTVSLMNVLRQRALPGTDFTDPAEVLTRLNAMFQMDAHDGLCFTMWYGVYDLSSRRLSFASAGHHPALLRTPGGAALQRLVTRSLPLGALPDAGYRAAQVDVPAGSELLLFSDGLFEVTDREGRNWGLDDVLPLLDALAPGDDGPARLYRAVRAAIGDGPLDDDCSIVAVTFL
jgi:pSer/pThr/pTyr-binding forkhead associated (FHA) protein